MKQYLIDRSFFVGFGPTQNPKLGLVTLTQLGHQKVKVGYSFTSLLNFSVEFGALLFLGQQF